MVAFHSRDEWNIPEARMAFWNGLRARVAAVPGVEAAGEGMVIPFSGGGFGVYFSLPGNRRSTRQRIWLSS
jgi:hypothetical protein